MSSTLTREAEYELAVAIRNGSIDARNALVMASQGLVKRLAAKYGRKGVPRADIVSEGNVGLLRAVDEFDPTEGVRFATYATWWIRRCMLALVLGGGDVIRIPPHHWRIRGTETTEEQAKRLEASQAASAIFPLRSDQPAIQPEDVVSRCDDIALVRTMVDRLNPVESFILRARFGLDGEPSTREVVAAQTGLSVTWVAKIQGMAMEKLRTMVDAPEVKKIKRWRATVKTTPIECSAWTKGEARAVLKAMLNIDRKGRLPKGTIVEEIAS